MTLKPDGGYRLGHTRLLDPLSALLLIGTLWALTRQYSGIYADARFYLLVLLHHQFPDVYALDLYFKHGVNNRFTVFPYLHQIVVAWAGYEWGAMVMTIAGHIAWLGALWYLAGAVFREPKQALLAVGFAVLFPLNFGGIGLGEPFLTPRIFGEAMTMVALGLLIRGRPWRSLAMLALAMAMHPLMTLAGLLFWCLYQSWLDRRYLWFLPLGAAAMLALAAAGIAPFHRLLQPVDPEWLAIVKTCGSYCFESQHSGSYLFLQAAFLALVLASLACLATRERRMIGLSLAVMLIGRIVNWIGTDIYPNSFVLSAQMYRMGWLCSVMGAFAIAIAMSKIYDAQEKNDKQIIGFFVFFAFVCGIALIRQLALLSASFLAIALAVMLVLRQQRVERWLSWRLVAYGTLLTAVPALLITIPFEYQSQSLTGSGLLIAASLGLAVLAGWAVMVYVRHMSNPSWSSRRPYQLGLLVLFLASALIWDQRSDYQKYVERREAYDELRSLIEPGEPIYWEGQVMVPWHVLRQQAYFSCEQGTGAIYERDLAREWMGRWQVFRGIGPLDFGKQAECPLDKEALQRTRYRRDLAAICQASPGLRYLALLVPAADDSGHVWRSGVPYVDHRYVEGKLQVRRFDDMHIYDCRQLVKAKESLSPSLHRDRGRAAKLAQSRA